MLCISGGVPSRIGSSFPFVFIKPLVFIRHDVSHKNMHSRLRMSFVMLQAKFLFIITIFHISCYSSFPTFCEDKNMEKCWKLLIEVEFQKLCENYLKIKRVCAITPGNN